MILRLLSLCGLCAVTWMLSAQPSTADADALARAFVTALAADSLPAFRPLAAADNFDRREWFSLHETLDRHRCIVIASHRVTSVEPRGDAWLIRIELEGRGTAENAMRATRPLPREWLLLAEATPRGLKLRHAMTAQQDAAMRYMRATSAAERERIMTEESANGGRDLLPLIVDDALEEVIAGMSQGLEQVDAAAYLGIDRLEHAVEWFVRRGDLISASIAARAASVCARYSTDKPLSIAYAEAALLLSSLANDCDTLALGQNALGEALRHSGAKDAGEALIAAAGRMADSLDDPRIALRTLHNYGSYRTHSLDLREGIRATEEVVAKSATYGFAQGEAGALLHLAGVHRYLQEREVALHYERRAYAKLLEVGNRAWAANALANSGADLEALGQMDAALAALEKAERLSEDAGFMDYLAQIIGLRAMLLVRLKRIDEAECLMDRARAILPDRVWIAATSQAANIWLASTLIAERRGRLEEALYYADGASVADRETQDSFLGVARVLRRRGRLPEAQQTLEDGVAVAERLRAEATVAGHLRRSRVFAYFAETYYELALVQLEQGEKAAAFATVERIKARAMADALAVGRSDLSAAATTSERRRERELEQAVRTANQAYVAARTRSADVAAAESALEKARRELDRFTTELAARHGQRLPADVTTATEDDLRAALHPDMAVVAYSVAKEATMVFAATLDDRGAVTLHAVRLDITREQLSRHVDDVVEAIASRNLAHRAKTGALYDLLLAPVERRIRDRKTIAIVPDGVLWQLPFHALAGPGGDPLIERHAVFYAPSVAMLRAVRSKAPRAAPRSLLAFGNPTHALEPLPDADDEVHRIAEFYTRRAVYTGAEADEERFKKEAPRYGVLHLATHGVLHDRWPMYSAVLLAPAGEEDGVVEAREILQLELGADVAVLSACDTARGSIGAGEGVIGISWALLAAGCPTAVVSQWKAASVSTTQLMIEFHRQLAVEGRSKAEAMRQAQLALRRSPTYNHPFYWAAFIVVGASR